MHRNEPALQRIAQNIRIVRMIRNYDQQYVADRLHIARSTLSTWERGYTPVRIDSLIKLAAVFGLENYRQLIDFDSNAILHPNTLKNDAAN